MRGSGLLAIGLLALALSLPSSARAQVVWDGPMLVSPGASAGWGLHIIEPHPATGVGGLFTWRANPAPVGMGFRVGVVEGDVERVGFLAGLDVAGEVYSVEEEDFDLGVMWFAGAGFAYDQIWTLSFPLGMAVGWEFGDEDFALRPFIAPRMVVDARLGDLEPGQAGNDDDFDLGFAAELGVDLSWDSRFGVRAAGSFGDREAISVGVTFPGFSR